MRKIRNRKRLSILALAFLLLFITGSAFAFAPGILDITGNVRFAQGYVRWESVVPGSTLFPAPGPQPLSGGYQAFHTYQIVDARGRTNQRIEWNVYFTAPGFAMLAATAENTSGVPALVSDPVITFTPVGGTAITLTDTPDPNFGLSAEEVIPLAGVINPSGPNSSGMTSIDLFWNGSIPDNFTLTDPVSRPVNPNAPVADQNRTFGLAGVITVSFDYTVAP